jgi:CheY-like chemotaxis protein
MKVLVVSNSQPLRATLAKMLRSLTDSQAILVDHDDALVKFLDEEPQAVIICEYDESGSRREEYNQGRFTFKDITGSADEGLKIIRMGFSDYSYEDYVKAPFKPLEILKRL